MTWLVLIIFGLLVILWGFISSNLVIKSQRYNLEFNPGSFGVDYESFKTRTDDQVEIDGWFVPCKSGTKSTILILHGWGANRSDVVPTTIFLAQKYNLVYFDFRNHGLSGGKQTSLTYLEIKDFIAVVKFLKSEKKEFTDRLGVFGFSMGAAVALSGTVQIPEIGAVVAESPFSSYNSTVYRFAKIFFGVPQFAVPLTLWFTKIRLGFDPEKHSPIYHVSKIAPRPVLIIQGASDARMPVSEGQALYGSAREPKELWVVPNADHGHVYDQSPEEYQKRILNFFQKWIKS